MFRLNLFFVEKLLVEDYFCPNFYFPKFVLVVGRNGFDQNLNVWLKINFENLWKIFFLKLFELLFLWQKNLLAKNFFGGNIENIFGQKIFCTKMF